MIEQLENDIYKKCIKEGRRRAYQNRKDADGCIGCLFDDVEEWEMPCAKCQRNFEDYWREKNG